jgi:hypothetical protein
MGKSVREERVEEALYPLTLKRVVIALRPGMSGKNPETLGKTRILQPSKVITQETNRVNVLVQRCLS